MRTVNPKLKINEIINSIKNKSGNLNILITGSTGCGKSSTINALFGQAVAKVGMTPDPETMSIGKYELAGITLWDSPGLGDGIEKDSIHAEGIVKKLKEVDHDGKGVIDIVLVIIEGITKDMGSNFRLINEYIIPNIDTQRIIVAINKADAIMNGRYWDFKESRPEPKLQKFLEEKELSVHDRIKESTNVEIWPISYSAGFSDPEVGDQEQPYNLLKLLYLIYTKAPAEKRFVFVDNINENRDTWKSNDNRENYAKEIKEDFTDRLLRDIKEWGEAAGDIGEELGEKIGLPKVGKAIGTVVGGTVGAVKSFLSSLLPF